MTLDSAWLSKLGKLGLSKYEARIYLTLLEEGEAPAAKLVRKSGVPQPRVYVALGVLVERGFAELVLGDNRTYRAVQPTIVFERHQRRQEDAFRAAMVELNDEMKALQTAVPDQPTEDAASYGIRLVRGTEQMQHQMESVFAEATEQVCMLLPHPPMFHNRGDVVYKMLARGAHLRVIVDQAYMDDPALGPIYINHGKKTGDARWVPQVPVRMCLVDGKKFLLPLDESGGGATLLEIPNRVIAQGMQRWFELLWASAHDVATYPVPSNSNQA